MGEMGAREGNGAKSQSRVFIIQLGKGTDVGKRGQDEGAGPRATPWHRGRGRARGDATAASAVPQHPFGGKPGEVPRRNGKWKTLIITCHRKIKAFYST